jgi:hypothetical protein
MTDAALKISSAIKSVEIRTYVGGESGLIPHTFLHVVDINGIESDVGFLSFSTFNEQIFICCKVFCKIAVAIILASSLGFF